jgi:hypothetical protein
MRRSLSPLINVIAILVAFVVFSLAELIDAGLAADDEARSAIRLPSWWPLAAVIVLALSIIGSSIWPWGFA